MTDERTPLAVSTQWPEARSFERLYHADAERQARFAMTLLGFRALIIHEAAGDVSGEDVAAIDTVLSTFHERYPEFMLAEFSVESEPAGPVYRADSRLISLTQEILDSRE